MSTLSTTNLKNPASSSNNIVLSADGSVTLELSSLNGGPLAGFRNRIINGDMRIAQRGTSFAAIADGTYSLDRWVWSQAGAMVCTVSQSSDVPNNTFQSSYKVDVTTADSSIAAGDSVRIVQQIEGYNARDLIGTTFTLSFWVKSPKTGVHCVSFSNDGADRSYIKEYTVVAANTWEYKTLTVPGGLIAAGTWDWTNGIGLRIRFALVAGTTFHTTADAWQTGEFSATANQVNVMDNTANDFFLTGVQLEPGSVATPFERRLIGTELALCQRYFQFIRAGVRCYLIGAMATSTEYNYVTPMRVVPNFSLISTLETTNVASVGRDNATSTAFRFLAVSASTGETILRELLTASAEL